MIPGQSKKSIIQLYLIKYLLYFKNNIKKINKYRRIKHLDNLYLSLVTHNSPKTLLDSSKHQAIDEFYSKFTKVRYNSHIFYTEKTGIFHKYYIPDSLYREYIDMYYNNWKYAEVIDNKCYYSKYFTNVNQPEMIVYRLNGFWYDNNDVIINFDQAVSKILSKSDCFIKKAVNSWGGEGVFYYNSSQQTLDTLIDIIKKIPVDIVIQVGLKQSSVLATINNDSVNTVRLLSLLRNDGTVKIYSSVLRMGIKGAKVDNASNGGISVGIMDNGQLKSVAYSNTGEKYYEHPSTHVKFGDFIIPNFKKMKDIVTELQSKQGHFRLIGWDMACDENNEPVLIEANLCDSELDFHQLNNGPVFGEDTEEILNEVFGNK